MTDAVSANLVSKIWREIFNQVHHKFFLRSTYDHIELVKKERKYPPPRRDKKP
jgi:hypothetical protein